MLIKTKKKILDLVSRRKISASEMQRKYLKYMRLVSLNLLSKKSYIKYQSILKKLPRVRYVNKCYLTGRSRGVYRKFRLSRHQIREKFRYLHGLMNSSW